jgi:hypothetical protein
MSRSKKKHTFSEQILAGGAAGLCDALLLHPADMAKVNEKNQGAFVVFAALPERLLGSTAECSGSRSIRECAENNLR